jgi:hypothetical protein
MINVDIDDNQIGTDKTLIELSCDIRSMMCEISTSRKVENYL